MLPRLVTISHHYGGVLREICTFVCICKEIIIASPLLPYKGSIRLGFHDRKYQVIENEKFEEWATNRPNDSLLQLGKLMHLLHN